MVDSPPRRGNIWLMDFDISRLLENWEYQPGQLVVRKFKGKDGREKLQLRVDLGIMQMNTEGRPDGKRPLGYSSLYEYYQAKLYQHLAAHNGSDEGFVLKPEDCGRLQLEALQYHQRYFCFLQLEEFSGVVRDAERNQAVLNFVKKYAPPELASALRQFQPQLLMALARARAGQCLAAQDFGEAIRHIEEGIEKIREYFQECDHPEMADQTGEVMSLETWLSEIRERRPLGAREKLERALAEAVKSEDYEEAARVRDALRELKE